jgi:hypothetical protein
VARLSRLQDRNFGLLSSLCRRAERIVAEGTAAVGVPPNGPERDARIPKDESTIKGLDYVLYPTLSPLTRKTGAIVFDPPT